MPSGGTSCLARGGKLASVVFMEAKRRLLDGSQVASPCGQIARLRSCGHHRDGGEVGLGVVVPLEETTSGTQHGSWKYSSVTPIPKVISLESGGSIETWMSRKLFRQRLPESVDILIRQRTGCRAVVAGLI